MQPIDEPRETGRGTILKGRVEIGSVDSQSRRLGASGSERGFEVERDRLERECLGVGFPSTIVSLHLALPLAAGESVKDD